MGIVAIGGHEVAAKYWRTAFALVPYFMRAKGCFWRFIDFAPNMRLVPI
jgi:hypothetical protein